MLVFLLLIALGDSTPKPVDWKALIPTIRSVLKNEGLRNPEFRGIEQPYYSIGIRRTADIGDGVPEAPVYRGTGGGIHGCNDRHADRQ